EDPPPRSGLGSDRFEVRRFIAALPFSPFYSSVERKRREKQSGDESPHSKVSHPRPRGEEGAGASASGRSAARNAGPAPASAPFLSGPGQGTLIPTAVECAEGRHAPPLRLSRPGCPRATAGPPDRTPRESAAGATPGRLPGLPRADNGSRAQGGEPLPWP